MSFAERLLVFMACASAAIALRISPSPRPMGFCPPFSVQRSLFPQAQFPGYCRSASGGSGVAIAVESVTCSAVFILRLHRSDRLASLQLAGLPGRGKGVELQLQVSQCPYRRVINNVAGARGSGVRALICSPLNLPRGPWG